MPEQLVLSGRTPRPANDCRIFNFAKKFFRATVTAIRNVRGQLVVRTSLGDIASVLEQRRYGLTPLTASQTDPKPYPGLPTTFDRIHLTNIPDYVGSALFSSLDATPLLKHHKAAFA